MTVTIKMASVEADSSPHLILAKQMENIIAGKPRNHGLGAVIILLSSFISWYPSSERDAILSAVAEAAKMNARNMNDEPQLN